MRSRCATPATPRHLPSGTRCSANGANWPAHPAPGLGARDEPRQPSRGSPTTACRARPSCRRPRTSRWRSPRAARCSARRLAVRCSRSRTSNPSSCTRAIRARVQTTLVVEDDGERAPQRAQPAVSGESRSGRWRPGPHTSRARSLNAARGDASAGACGRAIVDAARERCRAAIDRQRLLRRARRQGQPVGPVLPGRGAGVDRRGRSRRAHRAYPRHLWPRPRATASTRRFRTPAATSGRHRAAGPRPRATGGAFVGGGVGEMRFHHSPAGRSAVDPRATAASNGTASSASSSATCTSTTTPARW